jgi:endoglucanase
MFKAELFSSMKLMLLLVVLVGQGCVSPEQATKNDPDPFERNKQFGRGVNIGNALEAPNEGEWGVTIQEEYFELMKKAGFDSVRIPVRWSSHAMKEAPYTIDKTFLARVDWAVDSALAQGLGVMLNIHHYEELYTEPIAHKERFMAFWKQLSEHYKGYPDTLFLEIFNEPHDALTPEMWNKWLTEAHAIIRKSNPTKTIVIGSANYNGIAYLEKLELPANDNNIIVTVHHYLPLEFTHQGAEWVNWDNPSKWMGTKWMGTDEEKKAMTDTFDIGAAWSKKHNRPLNLGEFGSYEKADMESRVRWTKFIADTAVERGMSFHYWEFCANGFGIYSPAKKEWRRPLLDAIIPAKKQGGMKSLGK